MTTMRVNRSRGGNEQILAAALSAILGKEILPESDVPQGSSRNISKISLFDQHLTSFVYGKVGRSDSTRHDSIITVHVTILATKTTFPCQIERDATVDELKMIIYNRSGVQCNKQNLIYCGEELDEGHRLNEYNVADGGEIAVVRLRMMNINDILVLDSASRDTGYDYDFTNIDDTGKTFKRGGEEYRRPCGWERFAIKTNGRYDDDAWLGSCNGPDEWPVSYHGTHHEAAVSIAQAGYDLTKHKRFLHGRGIYTSPDIEIAKFYAKKFVVNGVEYLVILQNRVNPSTLMKVNGSDPSADNYWVSPEAADIRPYGILIKKAG